MFNTQICFIKELDEEESNYIKEKFMKLHFNLQRK